jgi:hypothetical protein
MPSLEVGLFDALRFNGLKGPMTPTGVIFRSAFTAADAAQAAGEEIGQVIRPSSSHDLFGAVQTRMVPDGARRQTRASCIAFSPLPRSTQCLALRSTSGFCRLRCFSTRSSRRRSGPQKSFRRPRPPNASDAGTRSSGRSAATNLPRARSGAEPRSPAPIIPRAVVPGTIIGGRVAAIRWGVATINRGVAAIIAVPWSAIVTVPGPAIVTVTRTICVRAGRYATDHRACN